MLRRSFRPALRLTALLASAMLMAVVVWQAPHTVHHLFDPDDVRPQHECVLATSAERGLSTAAEAVTFVALHDVDVWQVVAIHPLLPEPAARPAVARAPPVLPS